MLKNSCRLAAALGLGLSLVPLTPIAHAQVTGSVPIQNFMPNEATTGGFNHLLDAQTSGHLRPSAGLVFNFARRPLTVVNNASDEAVYLVQSHAQIDLMGGLGIGERLQVGLAIPVTPLISAGDDGFVETPDISAGLGDMRVSGLFRLMGDGSGLDLALAAVVGLPTGKEASYLGAAGLTFEPRLVAGLSPTDDIGLALNLGYLVRTADQAIAVNGSDIIGAGNELSYGLGARYTLSPDMDILAELYGRASVDADIESDTSERPLELDIGARKRVGDGNSAVIFGLGTGIISGYGAPQLRIFAGYAWAPQPPGDTDGDGFNDRDDQCPEDAEDLDSYQDDDGCPDPDNDRDGVLDVDDKCASKMEDGLGAAPGDGCPDPDTDGDGVSDGKDRCADTPEDLDGFQDGDGCPDPDNDKDGILDGDDKCPLEKEVINGVDDEDGCPDEGESAVQVTDTHIEIKQRVFFKTNSDVIEGRSFSVLDQVALALKANMHITQVEIQGHTDDVSAAEYNLKLSHKRAQAVKAYLASKGVDPGRLRAIGYGESEPLVKGTSKKARAQNRRVEFKILQVDGKPIEE